MIQPANSKSPIWSESVSVHSYEADFQGRASLETLCRFFQEAAWKHAEALGVGYHHLARRNELWVLARLRIEASRFPRWSDSFTIETWPRATRSAFALRDFQMLDSSGARLAAGSSAWLVLDAATRKPHRSDKLLASMLPLPERRAIAQDPTKLSPTAPAAGSPCITKRAVRYSDLDVNNHVTSSRYVGWLLDTYPLDFLQAHVPALLEINYLDETHAQDLLLVSSHEAAPLEYHHSILKSSRTEPACLARLGWREC